MAEKKFRVTVSVDIYVEADDWQSAEKKVKRLIENGDVSKTYQNYTHVEHVTHLDDDWNPV